VNLRKVMWPLHAMQLKALIYHASKLLLGLKVREGSWNVGCHSNYQRVELSEV
jgi:hypothetical protein